MQQNTSRTTWENDGGVPAPLNRVLVVEDDAAMRKVLNEVLPAWSFVPSMAADLREARTAFLTDGPFAVIVSDYHLPDGTGLEFLDWLKRERMVRVPFLLISSGLTPVPSRAKDCEFLAKPFRLQEFRSRLKRLSSLTLQPAASYRLSAAQAATASVYARYRPAEEK